MIGVTIATVLDDPKRGAQYAHSIVPAQGRRSRRAILAALILGVVTYRHVITDAESPSSRCRRPLSLIYCNRWRSLGDARLPGLRARHARAHHYPGDTDAARHEPRDPAASSTIDHSWAAKVGPDAYWPGEGPFPILKMPSVVSMPASTSITRPPPPPRPRPRATRRATTNFHQLD